MPGCSAYGCSNRSELGYCMKSFPRDPKRRALWESKVGRYNWKATNNSFLCEVHFEPQHWVIDANEKKKLKFDAVPTIFSHIEPRKKKTLASTKPCKQEEMPAVIKVKDDKISDLEEEFELIREVVCQNNEVISNQENEIKNLKRQLNELTQKNLHLQNELGTHLLKSKYISKLFREDQLQALMSEKKSCFQKWCNETVETAHSLRSSCGRKGYAKLLKLNFPFPSDRTLQRHRRNKKLYSENVSNSMNVDELLIETEPVETELFETLPVETILVETELIETVQVKTEPVETEVDELVIPF